MKGTFTPAAHYERMDFVLPCYACGAPKPALDFLDKLPLTDNSADYMFLVTTCNVNGGDTSYMLDKALRSKGLCLQYYKTVRMVRNYVVNYSLPDNPDEILQKADVQLQAAAVEINNQTNMNPSKRHLYYTVFYAGGNLFLAIKRNNCMLAMLT